MSKLSFVGVVIAVGVLLSARPAGAQQDQVFDVKGLPKKGTVTKTSPTEVTLEIAGAARGYPANEIRKVTFFGEPSELDKAREQVRTGNFSAALEEVKKIKEGTMRDVIKQDIQFYTAFCSARLALAGEGDKTAAGVLLNNFITNNPNSYHYFEACESLGDLAASVGKFDGAAKFYGRLSEAPWPEYKLRAYVYEARALLAGEKYAEALQRYEQVIGSSETTPEAELQKKMATTGKAICLAHTGKGDEGMKLLEEIIKETDIATGKEAAGARLLFARAYNALGACHLKAGRKKDALTAYLHVHLLFPDEDDETHAEALYNLTKLWTDQNKSDRSASMRKLLTEKYPASLWASKK